MASPTVNLRVSASQFADDTEDDGTPLPTPVNPRRAGLPYATTMMLAHPRLIPRADFERKRTHGVEAIGTPPPRRLAHSSLPTQPRSTAAWESWPDRDDFELARGSAPQPIPQPPLHLPVRKPAALPPPLRHRLAPPPLRPAAQADELAAFDDDRFDDDKIVTVRVR